MRGLLLRAALLAVVVTLVPPVGQVRVLATPVTLSETLEDLPEQGTTGSGLALAGQIGPQAPSRSAPIAAPLTFNAVGLTVPQGTSLVRVRTSVDGTQWSPWDTVELLDEEDGPDPGTAEAAREQRGPVTEPLWVGEASYLQVEVVGGDVGDVEVTVIDSMGSSGGPVHRRVETVLSQARAETEGDLEIVSRAQWGADESWRNDDPRYADAVHIGIVHHTAHASTDVANSYTRDEAPGIMRAMYRYHTQSLGWSDIGYNVVVDRFGTIYEGRAGGFGRSVIGAHARGFNTGSFGVSVMGNFIETQASAAAIESLTRVIGVKAAIHGIDPQGVTDQMADGQLRPTIVGHRDVGQTSCPGRIHDLLPQIRSNARVAAVRFPDVAPDSPHREAIMALAAAGVTRGCEANAFCPKGELTRAQASSFVLRALELEPVPGSGFTDVPADFVHAPAINALAQRGWLIGYDDGTFRPSQRMTRGQLATLLSRALDVQPSSRFATHYSDVHFTHAHRDGIVALDEAGVSGNCGGGNFCPDDIALRDSTASFVHMVRGVLGQGGSSADGLSVGDSLGEGDPETAG